MRTGSNGNGHRRRDLEALIDVYLLRCEVEGKSQHTLAAYGETLGRFAGIASAEGFPEDVTRISPAHLYTYLGRYTGTPWKPATATSARSAASSTG